MPTPKKPAEESPEIARARFELEDAAGHVAVGYRDAASLEAVARWEKILADLLAKDEK